MTIDNSNYSLTILLGGLDSTVDKTFELKIPNFKLQFNYAEDKRIAIADFTYRKWYNLVNNEKRLNFIFKNIPSQFVIERYSSRIEDFVSKNQ